VANAIEATPPGGAVNLETQELTNGDQQWVLHDTGHGIPDDQLARLGHSFHWQKEGGSGLGVALARAAIAQHGGLMRVESHGGAGTAITIVLAKGTQGCAA
jgi:two-component system, sporulation sensor kinase A